LLGQNSTQPWNPIFEVNKNSETATLIIVSNAGISYPQKQTDPIFPAESTDKDKWYYNTRWHGSVLGCLDRTYVCLSDEICGGLQELEALGYSYDKRVTVLLYLFFSLLLSGIGSSLAYRTAEALDANAKLVNGTSYLLDAEQWKVEVTQLFQTSLARIQITARDIARANPNTPHAHSTNLADEHPELRELCRMYKFRSVGWRNVGVFGFLGAIAVGLMVLFLGRTTGEENEELRVEGYYGTLRQSAWKKSITLRNGLRDGYEAFGSFIGRWLGEFGKAVGKYPDKLKRLRANLRLSKAIGRSLGPRLPNGTDPRISDGIEMYDD
jgi:hypothetical protein